MLSGTTLSFLTWVLGEGRLELDEEGDPMLNMWGLRCHGSWGEAPLSSWTCPLPTHHAPSSAGNTLPSSICSAFSPGGPLDLGS